MDDIVGVEDGLTPMSDNRLAEMERGCGRAGCDSAVCVNMKAAAAEIRAARASLAAWKSSRNAWKSDAEQARAELADLLAKLETIGALRPHDCRNVPLVEFVKQLQSEGRRKAKYIETCDAALLEEQQAHAATRAELAPLRRVVEAARPIARRPTSFDVAPLEKALSDLDALAALPKPAAEKLDYRDAEKPPLAPVARGKERLCVHCTR